MNKAKKCFKRAIPVQQQIQDLGHPGSCSFAAAGKQPAADKTGRTEVVTFSAHSNQIKVIWLVDFGNIDTLGFSKPVIIYIFFYLIWLGLPFKSQPPPTNNRGSHSVSRSIGSLLVWLPQRGYRFPNDTSARSKGLQDGCLQTYSSPIQDRQHFHSRPESKKEKG